MCVRCYVLRVSRRKVIRSEIFPVACDKMPGCTFWWRKHFFFPAAISISASSRLTQDAGGPVSEHRDHLCAITFQWRAFANNNGISCHRLWKQLYVVLRALTHALHQKIRLVKLETKETNTIAKSIVAWFLIIVMFNIYSYNLTFIYS